MAPTYDSRLKTTTTTAPFLPSEIITDEIFPKLPAKSLVRFKCVSKFYNTLISSPEFIEIHLRQSLSSDSNRLLIVSKENNPNLYSFDIDSPNSSTTASTIALPKTLGGWLEGNVSIIGSFNGLICVGLTLYEGEPHESSIQVLINPSTGLFREIPYNSLSVEGEFRVSFGFGYDDVNHDYKIVRVTENAMHYCPYAGYDLINREVTVYSLNQNKWKLVEFVRRPKASLDLFQKGLFMRNHLLHWVFWDSFTYHIYCFDTRSDKWVNEVPLMELFTCRIAEFDEEYEDTVVRVMSLGVIQECLCVSTCTNLSCDVWIMKEYGVKESWVKLFEISGFLEFSHIFVHSSFSFRLRSKDEVLVRKMGKRGLFWCKIGSENYGETEEIEGIPDFEQACFFKGSLVPVPGGEKIQASAEDEEEMPHEDEDEEEMPHY
ncbi:hypothetical protein RND81_10G215000 [Saponaria officinalis]|uniref:F-box associated beta-propeller type 3 domain-containing protein n=1 Tax=Saponaria officinalis TaxID=3572 RepID=A0AAW1I4T4_SAPOF